MPVQWRADPNLKTGGYFYDDSTGQPLPPSVDKDGQPVPMLGIDNKPAIWDGTKYKTATQAAADTQATGQSAADALVAQYEAAHGKRQSEAYVAKPTIPNTDTTPGAPKTIPNPNPTSHYTFADGYSLDVDAQGNVVKQTAAPKPPTTTTAASQGVSVAGQGVWGPDPANPTGPWIQKVPGAANPDEDITKAVTRQTNEAQRNEREANAAAGKGYMTNQEAAAIDQRGVQLGQSQQQIDLDKQKFAETQRQFDAKQKLDEAKTTAEIAQSGAQTTYLGAQTGQVQTATELAAQKAPGEMAYTAAQTEAQKAAALASGAQTAASQATTQRTQQQIAQGNAPTVENIATTSPYVYQRDPNTGALTPQINVGFQPKTIADVAGRVSQLQAMAQAQRDALMQQQQSGAITSDQAAQKFDQWWSQNVEPQKAQLDAAQRQATLDQQQKLEEQNRSNYATAQAAGVNAVDAQKALLPYMVGPGFGAALNNIQSAYASGKAPGNIDIGSAVTFQLPDMQALATQATNQALAHISPTAAQNMGQATGLNATPQMAQQAQQPQNMDVSQALNQNNYKPSVTVMPDGTVHINQNNAQPQPPVAPAPPTPPPPGMYTPAFQQQYPSAVGQPATGPVVGGNLGGAWGVPNYKPLSEAVAPGQMV